MEDQLYLIKTEKELGEAVTLSLLDNRQVRCVTEEDISLLDPKDYELLYHLTPVLNKTK